MNRRRGFFHISFVIIILAISFVLRRHEEVEAVIPTSTSSVVGSATSRRMQASSSSFHWSFIQKRSSLPTLHHAAKNGQAAFFSFDSHRGGSRLEINMLQPRQCHRHQLRNGYCTFRHMAFYYSRGSSSGVRIPLLLSSSSSSSSYYNLATSAAASSQSISSSSLASSSTSTSSTSKASSTLPFPEWWPPPSSTSDDDAALNHPNQYIKFADHVAHLVIPVGNTVAVPTHGEHEVVGENNSNADDRIMMQQHQENCS